MPRTSRHEETEPLMNDSDDRRDDAAPSPRLADNSETGAAATDTGSKMNTTTTTTDAGHPDAPLQTLTSRRADTQMNNDRDEEGRVNRSNTGQLEVQDDDSGPDSGVSTPRFLQDERSGKRWRWIPYPVRRIWKKVVHWSHGPPDPQPYRIRPFFPVVQDYPLYLAERFLPRGRGRKRQFWLLFLYFSLWIVTFALVKRQGTLATEIVGWGEPEVIGCGTTYWMSGNGCGVDGDNCRPFNSSGFPFRCAANCETYHLLNPRAVGDQEVIYRSLVVGGPSNDVENPEESAIYRGDSFICGAAIHAGVITNANGGCGVVELAGRKDKYVSTERNGITSVGFDSYFPLSFHFLEDTACSARDMRWSLLAVSVVFTTVLSIFTSNPALFFFPNFIGIFWTIGMAIDPPPHKSVASLFSNLLGKFLPAMFVAWVMYDKMGIRRTLTKLTAQFEKTILWLGPCWVGAMDNYTLSFIPIQRLNAHDLNQQPGAKAALAIIIIVLVVVVVSQIYFFRQEGRLLKYLGLYAVFVFGILISLALPGLNLRIHHYILALLLLPGTSLQTRPSLIYQGLLIGLFINGISRWGFDPVLQTPSSLQGDAQNGSILPTILEPIIQLGNSSNALSNITFTWDMPSEEYIDGISILVNDVERFRSYFEDEAAEEREFFWSRNTDLDLPEYFRFAFMEGSKSGDYSKAGIWTADGEWEEMQPGPSKVKVRSLDEEELIKRGRR